MPVLCQTLRKEAGTIWNRMRKAAFHGISLSEETLTECALYDVALTHQGGDIVIDLATKHDEAKHGADWEWWIVCGNKGIGFRVQAKRLFPSGRYQSLFKSGGNPYQQLDKLVSASTNENLVPLYCFYNFAHPQAQFSGSVTSCKHTYHAPSFWGCSLALPQKIKGAKSDKLADLQSLMYPWHLLVCELHQTRPLAAASAFVRREGRPERPRALPDRIRRLIEIGDRRRKSESAGYLYDDFADEIPADKSGVVVFRDLR
jgi:hypothetical protein